MADKLVTLRKKNGDNYLPKTSIEQVVGLETDLAAKQGSITAINEKIPAQATSANQLADKDFVNSSINAMAADFISADASNSNFATKAALLAATTFYRGGVEYVPQKNDYMVVLADESQNGAQVRYLAVKDFTSSTAITDEIQLQYIINDAPFTAAQNAAIDSGITAGKVTAYDELVENMDDYLTESDAETTYATKTEVAALGTVHIVQKGADLSGFGDNDLIIELEPEEEE